jgi:hypothetical protein
MTPTPAPSAFLTISVIKFAKFLTPPPLKNANFLNQADWMVVLRLIFAKIVHCAVLRNDGGAKLT